MCVYIYICTNTYIMYIDRPLRERLLIRRPDREKLQPFDGLPRALSQMLGCADPP